MYLEKWSHGRDTEIEQGRNWLQMVRRLVTEMFTWEINKSPGGEALAMTEFETDCI